MHHHSLPIDPAHKSNTYHTRTLLGDGTAADDQETNAFTPVTISLQ